MIVPILTLLKDILLHALTTHILGAILADKIALQAQIFLHVIFLGVFNCCHRFLFPFILPTVHSVSQDLILITFMGVILIHTVRIFIQNVLLTEQVSENLRVQQIVDANLAFRQQEMTVIPFRNNTTQGLQLCRKSLSFQNQHSIDSTLELLKSLSFRASIKGHEQSNMQSGEVHNLSFPTIESLIQFILTQAEGKVLAGTATENHKDDFVYSYMPRNFSFAIIVSEGSLNEFLLGLKLDNSQESISSNVSSRISRKKATIFTQTESIAIPAPLLQDQLLEVKEDTDSEPNQNNSSRQSLESNCSPLPLVGTPHMGPLSDIMELESKENYINSEYKESDGSINPSSQQKNVFFHSSHVESDLGDGEISVFDRISGLKEKSCSSKIVSKHKQLNKRKSKAAAPLSKSLSQKLLPNFNKHFKVDEETSSSLSIKQKLGEIQAIKKRKRSSSGHQSSIANIKSQKQSHDLANINLQLIEQINKLKSQIETNKIFTFMIVHDLKHPTESLIDSLQFVMQALKKLEDTFQVLSESQQDIQQVNSGVSSKLQDMKTQLESLRLELKTRVSDRVSQDWEVNFFKNRSEMSRFSALSSQQERIIKDLSGSDRNQFFQRAELQISDGLGEVIIEESKEESRDFTANKNQSDQSSIEEPDSQRKQSFASDMSSAGMADFEEGVTDHNIGKFIRNSSKNLFQLAGKKVQAFESEGIECSWPSGSEEAKESKRTFSLVNESSDVLLPPQVGCVIKGKNMPVKLQDENSQTNPLYQSEPAAVVDSSINPLRDFSFIADDVSFGPLKKPEQKDSNLDAKSQFLPIKQDLSEIIESQQRMANISDGLTGQISKCQTQIRKAIDTVNTLNYTSEMMRNLMMDLLDLAQMEKNTFKLNKDFFSIFEVIQKAFMLLGHVSNKQKVTLKMPEVSDTMEQKLYQQIYGDKNRFLQVIINFLSNSLKFSQPGSEIHLHLTILENHVLAHSEFRGNGFETSLSRSRSAAAIPNIVNDSEEVKSLSGIVLSNQASDKLDQSENPPDSPDVKESGSLVRRLVNLSSQAEKTSYIEFRLDIQDFGIGIPADKLDNLFINFGNLEEHQKTNPQGRGLGLSICKSIVEQMGGKVIVKSELGKGSTFSMTFKVMCKLSESNNTASLQEYSLTSPIHREETSRNFLSNRNKKQDEVLSSQGKKKPRLLLVNDTQFLLYTYELQLEDTFTITTAENGLQALQIVTSEPPNFFDIILLDINMPIMDGYEACSRITDYLYQEDSFFSMNPNRVSYQNQSSQLISNIETCNAGQLIKSQSHAMLDKIHPLSRALLVSSKSAVRSDFNIDDVDQAAQSTSKLRPLIYALTGEVSTLAMEKIKSYPFMGVFEKIGVEEAKFILDQIESRNDEYKSQSQQPKKSKRKPRPAQSQQNLLNSKTKISSKNECDDIDYLNVILEDDELAFESSNSVSSVEEEKIPEAEAIHGKFSESFKALPYNNGLPRGIDVGRMLKRVNQIRKKSSENKLSFFRPLAESLLPFDSLGLQFPIIRQSQSMQDLSQEMLPSSSVKDGQTHSQTCFNDQRQKEKLIQRRDHQVPPDVELTIKATDSSCKGPNSDSLVDFQSSQFSQVSPQNQVNVSNQNEDEEFSFREREI